MELKEILNYRRAIRHYDSEKTIDEERVRECIRLATLAPTSSNMQLWECYHVTDKNIMKSLSKACLGQLSATSAQQFVVFVTRQDLHRSHARAAMEFEKENVKRNSPAEKHAKRIREWELYYGKVMPFLYSRCFGLLGLFRKMLANVVGLFRPIVRQVSENDVRVVVHKSSALAVQTFMIAMSEAGYDTCPLEGFDSRRVKSILRLPCSAEINMIVSCGIRLPDGVWGDRFRLPFDEVYHKL